MSALRVIRRVLLTAVLAAACVVAQPVPTVPNGDMSEAFLVSATGDTMPNMWGTTACFGTAPTTVCMRWDTQDYTSAPASMRLDGTGDGHVYVRGISNTTTAEGGTLYLSGKLKITGANGIFRVALAAYCGGGGYTQTAYAQVVRQDTDSPWYTFSGSVAVQTSAYCASQSRSYAGVNIHVYWNGSGQAWLDDLVACANAACSVPVRLAAVAEQKPGVSISGQRVLFDRDADYSIRVLTAGGKCVSTSSGHGQSVAILAGNHAAGVYLVKVHSSSGDLAQALTVSATAR